ncbi:tryptophan--tRNA ligase [bacterium Unc6]|nr:tryptophan--tRNA ligase [bacterium Unc6]
MGNRKRILSGMRPSGRLHLGHLVGTLHNWIKLQNEYECFYMVADWHAFMSEYKNPQVIKENIIDNIIDWIACGIDTEKNSIFIQSHIKEHAELHLILSCITPVGWLERCPTYKEQIEQLKEKDIGTHAFLGYPILQSADILMYNADCVPVGEDQLPHLELTREIVRKFNHHFGDLFKEPQPLLTSIPKLLGLDGRKMSKSYNNAVFLSDAPDIIKKKISGMFTDPKRIYKTDPGHPDICNIFSWFKMFKPEFAPEVKLYCEGARVGCTQCKQNLSEAITKFLEPMQKKRKEIEENKKKIETLLEKGEDIARKVAKETMEMVRKKVWA